MKTTNNRVIEAIALVTQAAEMLRELADKKPTERTEADRICELVAWTYHCLPAEIRGETSQTRGDNKLIAARDMFGYILYKRKYDFREIGRLVRRERTWVYDAAKRVEDFLSIKDRLYFPQWESLKSLTLTTKTNN